MVAAWLQPSKKSKSFKRGKTRVLALTEEKIKVTNP
jgi:hypothetical protein